MLPTQIAQRLISPMMLLTSPSFMPATRDWTPKDLLTTG